MLTIEFADGKTYGTAFDLRVVTVEAALMLAQNQPFEFVEPYVALTLAERLLADGADVETITEAITNFRLRQTL